MNYLKTPNTKTFNAADVYLATSRNKNTFNETIILSVYINQTQMFLYFCCATCKETIV